MLPYSLGSSRYFPKNDDYVGRFPDLSMIFTNNKVTCCRNLELQDGSDQCKAYVLESNKVTGSKS